jgi:hypothetical protein
MDKRAENEVVIELYHKLNYGIASFHNIILLKSLATPSYTKAWIPVISLPKINR